MKKQKADTNLQLNLGFWGSTSIVALYPLIDLVNHHQPTHDSDAISYQLERSIHRTSLLTMADHSIAGEHVAYTYNPVLLEPPLLLENYGLAFPNNIFAKLALVNPNII